MKILALHGYRQSGEAFCSRTGALRKIISKNVPNCKIEFVTAPHTIGEEQIQEMSNVSATLPPKGWWFSRENDWYKALDVSDCDKGFDESLEFLKETFETLGPFDGILAFSQGAALAVILDVINLNEIGAGNSAPFPFGFALLIAPFRSSCSKRQKYYSLTTKLKTPTLIVYGENDDTIPKERSLELRELFDDVTCFSHPGAHFIPTASQYKSHYVNFLKRFV